MSTARLSEDPIIRLEKTVRQLELKEKAYLPDEFYAELKDQITQLKKENRRLAERLPIIEAMLFERMNENNQALDIYRSLSTPASPNWRAKAYEAQLLFQMGCYKQSKAVSAEILNACKNHTRHPREKDQEQAEKLFEQAAKRLSFSQTFQSILKSPTGNVYDVLAKRGFFAESQEASKPKAAPMEASARYTLAKKG